MHIVRPEKVGEALKIAGEAYIKGMPDRMDYRGVGKEARNQAYEEEVARHLVNDALGFRSALPQYT
jgi:hypothetical protein